jgi:hypothetical protein
MAAMASDILGYFTNRPSKCCRTPSKKASYLVTFTLKENAIAINIYKTLWDSYKQNLIYLSANNTHFLLSGEKKTRNQP